MTLPDCNHFWSAWYLTAAKEAERACFYCGFIETIGDGTGGDTQ